MPIFKHNDEEVPRTAPKQREFPFQSPTAPVVPEVSMVLLSEKGVEMLPPGCSKNTPQQVKTTIKTVNQKERYFYYPRRSKKPTTPNVLKNPSPEVKIPSPNLPRFSYPPRPAPSQAATLIEQNISDSIARQLKLHENQICELKELIQKLSRELIELKRSEIGEHKKTRKMLFKPKINYESIGIQCKFDQETDLCGEDEQNVDKTDKRSEPKLEINQKATGSIPKIKTVKETSDEESSEPNLKMQLDSDLEKYEILLGVPRTRLNVAMEIMALTCKYMPTEKLRELTSTLKEPERTDVSIATRRYMEKYGLIGTIPEETTESSQESTNKILDSKAIKNQPKFM